MLNTTKIEKIQVCMSLIASILSENSWFVSCHSSFLRDYAAISLFTWVFPTVPYADTTQLGCRSRVVILRKFIVQCVKIQVLEAYW